MAKRRIGEDLLLEDVGGGGPDMVMDPGTVNPLDWLFKKAVSLLASNIIRPTEAAIRKRITREARAAFSFGVYKARTIADAVFRNVLAAGVMKPDDQRKAVTMFELAQEGGLGGQLVPPSIVVGGAKRKRLSSGFLVPYLERSLFPVVDTYTPLVLGGQLSLTSAGSFTVSNPSASSTHNFQTDGNRVGQFVTTATIVPAEWKSYFSTAMAMQRHNIPGYIGGATTTDGQMFSTAPEDNVIAIASATSRTSDRLVELNKLEFNLWTDYYSITNSQNTILNVTIIVFESRSFHNEILTSCLQLDLTEYNQKRAGFVALNTGFDTGMEETSTLYDPTKAPFYGMRTKKYWKVVQKKAVTLSAFETARLLTSGPVGVVPGSRMCRNAAGIIGGALTDTADVTDFTFCPGTRHVMIRFCGGETAYNAAVSVQQPGICSAEVTLTMGRHLRYRRLPPSKSSNYTPQLVDQMVPAIFAANARVYDEDTNTYVVPVTADP